MSPGPFLAVDWPAPASVRACATQRHGLGVSTTPYDRYDLGARHDGDAAGAAAVRENRQLLQAHAGLPAPPHWLRQVHGRTVVHCAGPPLDPAPEADAAVTVQAGTVLAILTADCLPVLFCSDAGDEIAAAHAGWRGLAAGVLEATVAAMRTPASGLMAWLGPAAGPRAYEVGVEVRDALVAGDAGAAAGFQSTRPGHWQADLYFLARRRLAAVGLGRVHGGGRCTISERESFFSHRRDGPTGRQASLIWLAGT